MDPYRDLERRRGLPLVMKAFLAFAIVALGASILWVGSGTVGPFISGVVRGFGGFVAQVGGAVGSTAPSAAPELSDAPSIVSPDAPWTNLDTTDITVTVPAAITGIDGYKVRLYVTLPDAPPKQVAEVPVGPLSKRVIPEVALAQGRNDFQASIIGPAGESDLSGIATWILDTSKPKVSVISPKDGAKVSKDSVTIKGKTQALSTLRLENSANGAVATATADKNGLWNTVITVVDGRNVISVMSTDPAGNDNTATLTLRKGQGKLTVSLTATQYRFKAARLPKQVTFSVVVTGSDGQRLQGATALFQVMVPGLEAIVSGEITTDADGSATYSTTIPSGALPGSGLATVLVTSPSDGSLTDRAVLVVE